MEAPSIYSLQGNQDSCDGCLGSNVTLCCYGKQHQRYVI